MRAHAAVERRAEVDADHAPTGVAHRLEQRGRAGAEMDDRHAGALDVGEDAPHVRLHVLDVVGGREVAHPGVEELDGVDPGGNLRAEVAPDDLAQLLHERRPRIRRAEHQPLRLREVGALAALDEVAREREGPARKADERHLELLLEQADRRQHVRERLLRIDDAQPVDLVAGRDGLVDDRPLALRELERRAHRIERQENVREEDRRVDPEAQRLQRHLDGELRRLA